MDERANISIPFARQRLSKSFDSCASFMTTIVAANFDWSIESCDKVPRDLNYERNTEKYGCAMKLTILTCLSTPPVYPPAIRFSTPLSFLGVITLSENRKHHSLICQQMRNPVFCMPKSQSTNKLCTKLGYLLPLLFAVKVVKQNPNLVPKLI